jgi:SAM-dependent methyltransferase
MDRLKLLRSSINLHWLRPDNALWVYGFAHTFGELCKQMTETGSTMDLGCGDGTTSFIMLDGEFDVRFDAYYSIQVESANMESMTKRSSSGSLKDESGDFYNTYTENWKTMVDSAISKYSLTQYTVGADWKDSLVKKANDLGVYESVAEFDANISPYPFEKSQFNFIFSTIIYWLNDPAKVLKEVHRLLGEDGIFAFSAPKPEILNNTLVSMMSDYRYPLLDRLDRGRHNNWERHTRNLNDWKGIIQSAGFEIIEYKQFHPSLQIAFGETNIRTLLGSYNVLYDRLLPDHEDIFLEFKEKWCAEMEQLTTPFSDVDYYDSLEQCYHAFVLKKK